MRFLVSRLSSLGDVVCTLPVAAALKKGHPGAEVVWLVDPRFRAIVERCSSVDTVVDAPRKVTELRDLMRSLGVFDAALDMQGLLKSALPIGFARASQKLGYHWQREGSALFSQAVRPDPSSIHIVDQYVDVARAAGGVADFAEFNLSATPEDIDSVQMKLRSKGWSGGPLAALNAGAGWASKRWQPQRIALVADRLDGAGITPVFLGAKADADVFHEAADLMKHPPLSLVGETNIGELVGLISLAKLHLGGDTGSSHIAAAVGTPAFGTYVMTRPERSCPYGQIHRCQSLDADTVAQAMLAEVGQC